MLRVGLTGGAGSGKSTVAAMLQELGAFVSKSDDVGRAMMQPGEAVYGQIIRHFGPEVVLPGGQLDRAVLARIAFQEGCVEELNRIVHPAVIAAQREWMDRIAAEAPDAVAVVESALLFETKHGMAAGAGTHATDASWRTRFDRIVLVTAPEETRLERYLHRENSSAQDKATQRQRLKQIERDARSRMAVQMTDEEKAALSDFVLPNLGTVEALRERARELYAALRAESGRRQNEATNSAASDASNERDLA